MKLGRAVLRQALTTLPLLVGDDHERALAVIDRFVAVPTPSQSLATLRELRRLHRGALHRHLAANHGERQLARAQAALAEVHGGRRLLDELAALSPDPSTGARLAALAGLLGAHHELAARIRTATAARRPLLDKLRPKAAAKR